MLGVADHPDRVVAGRYALEALIGAGGMGEVWRARHIALKSTFAIKLLQGASAHDDETRKRFLKEAQVTANLKSRHAVRVFDFGVTDDGIPFLAMELLEGETLGHRISRLGRISHASAVRLLRQAARALDRAHALGIVHRDFKPDNLIILEDEDGQDEVKVLDFGIAKLMGELEAPLAQPTAARAPTQRNPLATFTRTGNMVGTPCYMAPEQIEDPAKVGGAADIWAFGVVAYEALTGARPFDADTISDLLQKILERRFTPVRDHDPDLPEAFESWFQTACARKPSDRFPSAQSAVSALADALDLSSGASGQRASMTDLTTEAAIAMASSSTSGARRRVTTADSDATLDARALEDALSATTGSGKTAEADSDANAAVIAPSPPSNFGSGLPSWMSRRRAVVLAGLATCAVVVGLSIAASQRPVAPSTATDSAPAPVDVPSSKSAVEAVAPTIATTHADATSAPDEPAASASAARASEAARRAAAVRPGAPVAVAPAPTTAPTAEAAAATGTPAPTAQPAARPSAAPSPYRLPELGL